MEDSELKMVKEINRVFLNILDSPSILPEKIRNPKIIKSIEELHSISGDLLTKFKRGDYKGTTTIYRELRKILGRLVKAILKSLKKMIIIATLTTHISSNEMTLKDIQQNSSKEFHEQLTEYEITLKEFQKFFDLN